MHMAQCEATRGMLVEDRPLILDWRGGIAVPRWQFGGGREKGRALGDLQEFGSHHWHIQQQEGAGAEMDCGSAEALSP